MEPNQCKGELREREKLGLMTLFESLKPILLCTSSVVQTKPFSFLFKKFGLGFCLIRKKDPICATGKAEGLKQFSKRKCMSKGKRYRGCGNSREAFMLGIETHAKK